MLNIEKRNITNQVVEYLRENIQTGIWVPGQKINSENELTEILGVSRASIRFAIQHLVAVGVLESHQGKGTYVKELPISQIEEKMGMIYVNTEITQLIEFRRIVEVGACRLAAERLTEENIEKLQKYLDEMIKNESNSNLFIENDMAFHAEVLEATGNRLIMKSMEFVREQIEKQHRRFNTVIGVKSAIEYHTAILVAFRNRDAVASAKIMAKHLDSLTKEYNFPKS